jgi:type VI secretion system protein VasD
MKRRFLLSSPIAFLAAGCGPPPPAAVDLTIKAAVDLNRNAAGVPLSVAVRLYGLNARSRFLGADAYALMDKESAALGDEGSRLEEIVVKPGEIRKLAIVPKPDVRFIGAAVLFQDIDRARWRTIAPIAASGLTRLALTLGSNRSELEPA